MRKESCAADMLLDPPAGATNVSSEHHHGEGVCTVVRRWEQGGKHVIEATTVERITHYGGGQ